MERLFNQPDERFQRLEKWLDERFNGFEDRFNALDKRCKDLMDHVDFSEKYKMEMLRSLRQFLDSNRGYGKRSAASVLCGERQEAPAIKKLKKGEAAESDGVAQVKASTSIQPPQEEEDVEPTEMSLEEVESRIGSLIESHTITLLKSAVPNERLEGISSLTQQVQHLQDLDQSVELLIRLLCALPGWGEIDVQVIQVINHIAATAAKFSKKCVVLCLLGVSERLGNVKTREHAMVCLTTFSKAVGPGFVSERLCQILKVHKNPKVLSEGILWMVAAVMFFGVSELKLKDLIDLGKFGLQSSVMRTRNAAIKLLLALGKSVGGDITELLTELLTEDDLALAGTVHNEYRKMLYDACVV